MQADVVFPSIDTIEGIQAASGIVAFENDDVFARECEADACGHASHASTDDDGFEVLSVK